MPDEQAVVLLLVLPLAGFLVTGLVGRRLYSRAWVIAVPAIVVTWLIALLVIARANGRAAAGLLLAAFVVLGGLVYRLFTTG